MGDLLQPINIPSSHFKLVLLIAAGIVMTGGSGAIGFRFLPDVQPGSFDEFMGDVGLVFFGLATLLPIRRLFTAHGTVVTIDTQGFRDRRISEKVIPWRSIKDITTLQFRRQKIMKLAIDPAFEDQLIVSRLAKMARAASRAFGADGLSIACNDLKTDYETLFNTTTAFWKRYG